MKMWLVKGWEDRGGMVAVEVEECHVTSANPLARFVRFPRTTTPVYEINKDVFYSHPHAQTAMVEAAEKRAKSLEGRLFKVRSLVLKMEGWVMDEDYCWSHPSPRVSIPGGLLTTQEAWYTRQSWKEVDEEETESEA